MAPRRCRHRGAARAGAAWPAHVAAPGRDEAAEDGAPLADGLVALDGVASLDGVESADGMALEPGDLPAD
jgi:hypothetical protein